METIDKVKWGKKIPPGVTTRRREGRNQEAFGDIETRLGGVRERGHANCEASAQESRQGVGLLREDRGEDAHLRVYA